MPEFRNWQHSELESRERVLWIRGSLGIGKSVMTAYFIERLKHLHPPAIIIYFFGKSGKQEQAKTRDILRTLAFQYYQYCDRATRCTLEGLRFKLRNIDDLPMRLLCEELLLQPLEKANQDIYIVLDGVDELDSVSMDFLEPDTRELDIFITQLAAARKARVLFISRPEANITQLVPGAVVKSIGQLENQGDIKSYVAQTIAQSKNLQNQFANAKVDPFEYFGENARGLFLWVSAVLEQLKQTKSSTTFAQQLDSLVDASENMDVLYSMILSRYDETLKEILIWVVNSFEYLEISVLKSFIEVSLQTIIPNFQEFVEVQFGSILYLTPVTAQSVSIGLNHDTFLSYLLDPERCREAYYVDQAVAHAHIFRVCLKVLSTVDPPFPYQLYRYAATYWSQHQGQTIGSEFSVESLSAICAFFSSTHGFKQWLKYTRPPFLSYFPGPIFDKSDIENIGSNIILEIDKWFETGEGAPPLEIRQAEAIVEHSSKLLDYFGKGALQLWLYEDLPLDKVQLVFRIAMWCFCMRTGLEMEILEKLQSVAVNDFAIIRTWLGNLPDTKVSRKNLGIAYGMLRLWDQSAQYLGGLDEYDADIQKCLVASCMESGLYYDRVINEIASLDSRKDAYRLRSQAKFLLGCAHKMMGDLDEAITAFEASEVTRIIFFPVTVIRLHQLYSQKGDLEGVITIYERVVAEYPSLWWGWHLLHIGYRVAGDIEKSAGVFRRALAADDETAKKWASEGLRNEDLEKATDNVDGYSLSGIYPSNNTILTSRCTHLRRRLVCVFQYGLRQPY